MESRLPQKTALELRRRARAAGVRVVLIRRGPRFASESRQCYFVRTEDCDPYLAQLKLDRVDDLLDVDLTALREGRGIREASEHPKALFLVCTHGRHDACCSIRGNQVSRIACSKVGVETWECSHIGGDRFAANLVCFPHGIYYGRVSSADVGWIIDEYQEGRLSLDHYRGRCCYPFDVQAAEYFARRELGMTGIDALRLTDVLKTTDGSVRASFEATDRGRGVVRIVVRESDEAYRLTCLERAERVIPSYELESFELVEV